MAALDTVGREGKAIVHGSSTQVDACQRLTAQTMAFIIDGVRVLTLIGSQRGLCSCKGWKLTGVVRVLY